MNPNFQTIWDDYTKLALGTYLREVRETKTAKVYLSNIPGGYHNFATPKTTNPTDFNIEEIAKVLKENGNDLSIYLSEEHRKLGFVEHLIRKGCKYHGMDSWVILDTNAYHKDSNPNILIKEVDKNNFSDFAKVESTCFPDFPGNSGYLEVSKYSTDYNKDGIQSKFYVLYEDDTPVACGGLLYSKRMGLAYLHGAGTLENHRGKGYQTALIKYRVDLALENGIKRIYSSVEPGSISWSNCIKVGFYQATSYLMLQ